MATTLAAPPRRAPEPLPRRTAATTATAGRIPTAASAAQSPHRRGHHNSSNSSSVCSSPFLSQLRSTGYNNGIICSSSNREASDPSASSVADPDLSTLPRTTLSSRGPHPCQSSVRVNPLQYHQFAPPQSPQPPTGAFSPAAPRPSSARPADNYRPPAAAGTAAGLSPQLARLTRTLRRSSDLAAAAANNTDSAYSTATLATDYQSAMPLASNAGDLAQEDNVYAEISSPVVHPSFPTNGFFGGAARRSRFTRTGGGCIIPDDGGNDTATDVRNLSDFSDDYNSCGGEGEATVVAEEMSPMMWSSPRRQKFNLVNGKVSAIV